MPKRVYKLKGSGTVRMSFSAQHKSTYERNGVSSTQTTSETFDIIQEKAVRYLGKGRFQRIYHPEGFTFPWRMPSSYTRGHQILDLSSSKCTLNWSTQFSKGVGERTGPSNINIIDKGDWSRFMESRLDMLPLLTFNELARNNVAVRLKVKNATVNLSVSAAEFKKTVTGLASNFNDLVGIYRAVRKGNFSKAMSFLKPDVRARAPHQGFSTRDAAGRWLELQYAINPLIGDIKSGYDYINEARKNLMTYSVSSNLNATVPEHVIANDSYMLLKASGRRGVRTKVHYLIDSPRLREASRLGLTNPLLAVLEVIPYSFVLDWLLPVGNMLEALDATLGTTFISGTRTRWVDVDIKGETYPEYLGFTDWPNSRITPSPASAKIYSIHREALLSYPMVLPYVKNPFSTSHLINAVALVRNLFKR